MSSVTLAESAKLSQNQLVSGVIESVITVNRMYDLLPFDGIEGNALAYDRENVLGPVAMAGVGTTDGVIGSLVSGGNNTAERTAAKDPASFTQVTSTLTTILGDAEVNGLIQATRSSINNQTGVQIASKAKSAGRKYQDKLINGDGTSYSFPGLISLCVSGQTVDTGTDGSSITFEIIDECMDDVVDKDGEVDYLTAHQRTIRRFSKLLRDLGGTSAMDAIKLPGSGKEVPAYRGTPLFRNDYIPTNVTKGATTGSCSYLFAGTFDDGSRQHGIAGLTAETQAGVHVVDVGESESQDMRIWRVKWYAGLALFSEKGLAMADGIHAT